MAVVDGATLGLEGEVAATGEQITNHIHDDLVFFILSKLPLKSLKRFRCVCKSWALLFESPYFINIFRHNFISNHRSYNEDSSLLLCRFLPECFKSSLISLSGDSFQNMVKLDWPNPYEEDEPDFSILGSTSINGILCLFRQHRSVESGVLWNLTTQESKVIPPSPVEFVPPNHDISSYLCGFGYDPVRDDYKVIRHVCFFEGTDYENYTHGPPIQDPLWEIYSLRSNSWRKLDIDHWDIPSHAVDRLYFDGMCHWTGHEEAIMSDDDMVLKTYLVSFDLSNEVFFKTLIHSDEGSLDCLAVLNESIAVITNPMNTTNFYISILGEIGVSESWTKLFTLESLPCVQRPIGTGKKGDIFFSKYDDELIWFDLNTHMIEELGIKGDQIVLYKQINN